MIIETILSNFIAYENISLDNANIENFCYEMKNKDEKGRIISNVGGWQSDDMNYKNFNQNEMIKLFDVVRTKFVELSRIFKLINPDEMDIDNFWININKTSDGNKLHNHLYSIFSIVYYVRIPYDSGKIIFHRPSLDDYKNCIKDGIIAEYNEFNSATCGYTPRIGDLIIFPSWLEHYVDYNNSEEERISIAFNSNYKR